MSRPTRNTLTLLTLALVLAATSVAHARNSGRNPPSPRHTPVVEPAQPFSLNQIWESFRTWWAH
ncbi:MAG: hypothetical protein ACOVOT_01740 [Rubrivivax sp.]